MGGVLFREIPHTKRNGGVALHTPEPGVECLVHRKGSMGHHGALITVRPREETIHCHLLERGGGYAGIRATNEDQTKEKDIQE